MKEYAVFIGYVPSAPGDDGVEIMNRYLRELMNKGAIRNFSKCIIDNPDHMPSNLPNDEKLQRLLRIYAESADACKERPAIMVFEAEITDSERLNALTENLLERYKFELKKYRK